MPNTGRKRDVVWLSFEVIKSDLRKGIRAKCKQCGTELEGQVTRMKIHLSKCAIKNDSNCEDIGKLYSFLVISVIYLAW